MVSTGENLREHVLVTAGRRKLLISTGSFGLIWHVYIISYFILYFFRTSLHATTLEGKVNAN